MLESFDLLDNMTAPLRSIEDALGGVTTRLVGAEREVNRASAAFGAVGKSTEHLAGSAQKFGHTERQLAGDTGRLGESMHGLGEGTAAGALEFGIFLEIGKKVVDFLGEMARKVLEVGKEFAETAMHAGEFYARTKFALEFKFGTSGAAEALKDIEQMAKNAGVKIEDLTPQYQRLVATGLNAQNAKDILRASLDLRAGAGGQQDAADGLTETIARIQATPDAKIDTRELRSLQGRSGVDVNNILAELAKMKGLDAKTPQALKRIEEMAGQGSFSKEQLITAVMKATEKKVSGHEGGGFGTLALKFKDDDIEAQLNSLHDTVMELFKGVDTSAIAHAIGKISALLDPGTESGAKLQKIITEISDDIGAMIDKLTGGDNIGTLFDTLVSAVETAWAAIQSFIGGFMDEIGPALKQLQPLFDKVFGSASDGKKSFSGLATQGKLLADAIAFVAKGTLGFIAAMEDTIHKLESFAAFVNDTFGQASSTVSDAWEKVQGVFDGINLHDTGTSIVDGLWKGISDAWDDLVSNTRGLTDRLVVSIKGALGIQSPSKVFAGIGDMTAEGFNVGIEQAAPPSFDHLIPKPDKISKLLSMPAINAPSLGGATPDAGPMVPPPRVDASAIGSTTNNSAKHVTVGDIHVTVGAAAQGPAAAAQAHDIANSIRAEILRVLESNAREQ